MHNYEDVEIVDGAEGETIQVQRCDCGAEQEVEVF